MAQKFDLAIIGGGILGVSLSYFASFLNPGRRIAVIEQEHKVAFHTSGRNTGKVHAPYLYHPEKMGFMARAALCGFGMWETYARRNDLPFKRDGVLHISMDAAGSRTLAKYRRWGLRNGLAEDDLELVTARQLKPVEPAVLCHTALRVRRDASVDYAVLTNSLMADSSNAGTKFLFQSKATEMERLDDWQITLEDGRLLSARFVINAAGGASVDTAHLMGASGDLTDLFFRGEYWKAPSQYSGLTQTSVYTVPTFPEYPFLDPHWVIRVDGSCEIGPNAVPVFSPYGYDRSENIRRFLPKILKVLGSGARKAVMDRRLQQLALEEIHSSLSKSAMVERVRRFLPSLDPSKFVEKGTSGIRSVVINDRGRMLRGMILEEAESALHILNYNSPGATGALPVAACIIHELSESGLFTGVKDDAVCGPWRFTDILEQMRAPSPAGYRPTLPKFS